MTLDSLPVMRSESSIFAFCSLEFGKAELVQRRRV